MAISGTLIGRLPFSARIEAAFSHTVFSEGAGIVPLPICLGVGDVFVLHRQVDGPVRRIKGKLNRGELEVPLVEEVAQ